jgi:hypothetical protein
MAFQGTLDIREVKDGLWELLAPLVYKGREQTFIIPAGFQTDLATIPTAFRWLLSPTGKYQKAAVLHDWLLRTRTVSPEDADGIFRRAMRELDVSFLRRYMMWAAVRLAHHLQGASAAEFRVWLLVAIPSALFMVLPTAVVVVFLTIYWAADYLVSASVGEAKPHFMLGADAIKRRL